MPVPCAPAFSPTSARPWSQGATRPRLGSRLCPRAATAPESSTQSRLGRTPRGTTWSSLPPSPRHATTWSSPRPDTSASPKSGTPSVLAADSTTWSSTWDVSCSTFTPRQGSQRKSKGAAAKELPALSRGSQVVDVCSLREAEVLAVTRTHCKVKFQAPRGAYKDDNEEPAQIIPLHRLQCCEIGTKASLLEPLQRCFDASAKLPTYVRGAFLEPLPASHRDAPPSAVAVLSCVASKKIVDERQEPTATLSLELSRGRHLASEDRVVVREDYLTEGAFLIASFRQMAGSRFAGCVGVAWRVAIDTRNVGHVGYQEFVRGGRNLGWTGNYRKLWLALTGCGPEDGSLNLAELDPEGDALLCDFRTQMNREGLTLEDLWETYLDTESSGRVRRDTFLRVMVRTFGWDKPRAKALFAILDLGQQQDLSPDELEGIGLERRSDTIETNVYETKELREEGERQRAFDDFHGYVVRIYHNFVRGWRRAFTNDDLGKLTFLKFCHCCGSIGFRGKLKTLWLHLDKENRGYITLKDVRPDACEAINHLRLFLEENYRTIDDVWEKILDTKGHGKCTLSDWMDCIQNKLKYPGDARKLFDWLDFSGSNFVTLTQMEYLGMRRRKITTQSAREKVLQRQKTDREEADGMLRRFKLYLAHHYGSVVHAWRLGLDPDGDGKLQFTEFCARCRQISFQGNLKALWFALDKEDLGYISLEELDPTAVAAFEDFRRLVSIFFDDLESLWHSCMDPDCSGRCSLDEFREGCRALRYHKSPAMLFKYLDLRFENAISMDGLSFIDLPRNASREEATRFARDSGTRTLSALEDFLKIEYGGSIVRAWRKGFCSGAAAEHWLETLNAEQFFSCCRQLGCLMYVTQLYTYLKDRPKGVHCISQAAQRNGAPM
eukprot:TRINITY_DN17650_c1_g6_i1.p1 TRINITY_DN17650_c1_g6~~TRINITY_DN17650_c1_g6_i1.p1  ORF type:complete len:892 (-),score=120.93 TRINITY_DN17650_c1_g6_i1:216-2891(-)